MTDEPAVMGVAEVAALLEIKRPNVRKLLDRHGVLPVAELAVGPVWAREDIVRLKDARDADERARETDAKRRASALARGAEA